MQKRVKAAKLHIYYEVGGQDLRITAHSDVSGHSVLSGGEGRHLKFSKQGADVYSSTQQNTKRPRSSMAPEQYHQT